MSDVASRWPFGSASVEGVGNRRIQALFLVFTGLVIAVCCALSMRAYWLPMFIPDEFGYLAATQYILGNDWSDVSRGIPWYSFGYSLLIAPVSASIGVEDAYLAAQITNLLILAVSPLLIVYVLREIVPTASFVTIWTVAILIVVFPSVIFYSRHAWSETAVFLVPWLVAAGFLRSRSGSSPWATAAGLGVLLAFVYFLHARLIVTSLVALPLYIVLCWRNRRGLAPIAVFTLFFGVTFWGLGILKQGVYTGLYGGTVFGTQHSLVEFFGTVLSRMTESGFWRDRLAITSGHFGYLLVASAGFLPAGLWYASRRINALRSEAKPSEFVVAFLTLNFIGALASIAFSMKAGFPAHVYYGRYVEPTMLPILALGLLACAESKALRWLSVSASIVLVAVLIRLGWSLASQLPQEHTNWTLMTSLFSYRTPDWRIDPTRIAMMFSITSLSVLIAGQVRLIYGAIALAVLFLGSGSELVRTYSFASTEYEIKYGSFLVAEGEAVKGVVYAAEDGDPAFLRTQVKSANPALPVSFSRLGESAPVPSWGKFEKILASASGISHWVCDSPNHCERRLTYPWRDGVELGFVNAEANVTHSEKLSSRFVGAFRRVPIVKGLVPASAGPSVPMSVQAVVPMKRNLKLVLFITRPGEDTWLTQSQTAVFLNENSTKRRISAPLPLLGHDGSPLRDGRYELHAVCFGPEGAEWGTRVSQPLVLGSSID